MKHGGFRMKKIILSLSLLSVFTTQPMFKSTYDLLLGSRWKKITWGIGLALVAKKAFSFFSKPKQIEPTSNGIHPIVSSLLARSEEFERSIGRFPTTENRISKFLEKQEKIAEFAQNVRPLVNSSIIQLIENFIEFKKNYGSTIEKELYHSMNVDKLIDRLLQKRPLTFMTAADDNLLRGGDKATGQFETIGTDSEKAPLILRDYLSYDEMQISALIGVSTPTFFINDGDRFNEGRPSTTPIEEEGIYTGLVGARFEKPSLMEWQHMIVTPGQNTQENGYGTDADPENPKKKLLDIWSTFYGEKFKTFTEVAKDNSGRYVRLRSNMYFDTYIYKKRLKTVIKSFLIDANTRAQEANKKAYCHLVGLGLGVWQLCKNQAQLMMDVYQEILETTDLPHIANLHFSWFPRGIKFNGHTFNTYDTEAEILFQNETNTISIQFSQRNPAEKLTGNDEGKLLVAMYAWDSNSFPGNEYWEEGLCASGDPAAACSSLIPELQNPYINEHLSHRNLFITE